MTSRSSWKSLSLLTLAASLAACAGQGDVDRTQPDRIDKSIFYKADGTPKTFYYRQTYVGVPTTSAWAFEGMPTELMKVRFEIKEKYLLGYRAHDLVPGSSNDFMGAKDTPVLTFAIKSHFDVKREYNPGTGEQTNVISENTSDRTWEERQYMRVDWSVNMSQIPEQAMSGKLGIPELEVTKTPLTWNVSETDYTNPDFGDRPIISEHYLDFVQKFTATPDYNACLRFFPQSGWDDGNLFACGDAEIKVRTALLEVKPSSYEPMDYPDNYPILDEKGDPYQVVAGGQFKCAARSPGSADDCEPAQVGGFSKFGFFRTVIQNYDRKYGTVEAGRTYYANRWNIWSDVDAEGKSVFDEKGNLRSVPFNKRKVKPIVYYTNVEFPDDPQLWTEAVEVTKDWSDALRKTVAGMVATEAKPTSIISPAELDSLAAKQPEMVVLKKNSCNLAGVKEFLGKSENAKVAELVEKSTGLAADGVDKAHLTQVCSIMEAATDKLADGDANKFSWQRNGDLRYSFFFWVDRPAAQGPLGYGPSSADPETGEIVSASLYNYGAALDEYAQRAVDAVELVNGDISTDDLLSGKTIADVLRETAAARSLRDSQPITPEARAHAATLLGNRTAQGKPRLIPVPGGQPASKLSLIKGTALERQMMTPEILMAKLPMSRPGQQLSDADFAKASPANWLSPTANEDRLSRFKSLAQNGCVFLGEFADDGIQGLAIDLKDKGYSGDALYKELRRLIFRGLADHEMGHTMGLRHNFSGSTDALNYHDRYWQLRTSLAPEKWNGARLGEFAYSTVMDYGARFNSDVHGLGKYDHAAIRFGYGGLVDIMSQGALSTGLSGSWLDYVSNYLIDYTRLPEVLGGVSNLADGGVARYAAVRSLIADRYKNAKPNDRIDNTLPDRPYRFDSDEYIGSLNAKAWDAGANQREIIDDTIDRFKNYYVFNAFKRGRLTWSLDGYMNNVLLDRYFSRFTESFQYFYYFGDIFSDTDLGADLLKASVDSLNALGEVLQTPEPGEHCPTSSNPNTLVVPSPSGPNACLSGSTAMNIGAPQGKPYYINFSDDYYYRITRASSLYEKLAALIALTSTNARFYRIDTFADSTKYSLNYYNVFKDEVLNLLSGVIRNDPSAYGGYVATDGPLKGLYQPTPVVDLATWGQVKPAMPPYMLPGVKRVDTPVNKVIQYYAIGLALSNLSSTWDSTLDVSNYMAVHVKGSKDDVTYAPGTNVLEYAHPESALVYRAPVLTGKQPGIGAQVLQELIALTGKAGTKGSIPTKFGLNQNDNDEPYPDWYTAKKNLEDAQKAGEANTDSALTAKLQAEYTEALRVFQGIDGLVSYRVDLLNDIRAFRTVFVY
jgi:hypothetical protein